MRHAILACLLALIVPSVLAQNASPLTGTWTISYDYSGSIIYWKLNLTEAGGKVTGDLDGDKLEGTLNGETLHFHAVDPRGGYEDVNATVKGNLITGSLKWWEVGSPENSASTHPFTAMLRPTKPEGPPQRHEFTPTEFHRQFSAATPPVLHLWPGDTIHTTTVDAGGYDEHNVHRSLGGNPQTGPFYIETAMPGDTLVIHIVHLHLNRDSALSDDGVVPRASNTGLAVKMKDAGNRLTWHLDLAHNVATTDHPGDHLKQYTVPLHPMLGCIATAPRPGVAIPTGDSGDWGGNMDFNEVVEGNTLYLPVSNPGALLYFGDGHAAQGDGETTGDALETSMDVELTVDVIHGQSPNAPRVESSDRLMAMGLGGSLDDAIKEATSNMAQWLESTYHLTPSEIAQVFGTAAEYKVSEVADRNAGIVLKLRKDLLANIQPGPPPSPAK